MRNTHDCLADNIHSVTALEQRIQRSIPDTAVLQRITEKHPIRVTPYYLDLIDWDDPDDPIRKIAIPSSGEQNLSGSFDTSGERHNTKLPGPQLP
ncbi:MAG: KamA family radical SAM protein, partial [Candidatus Electrothrix sp. ATG2]|nr:KamA family radical SAM protein [Candidatus Electrothrix sp. ATG2]